MSRPLSSARSMGNSNIAPLNREALTPLITEVASPKAFAGFATRVIEQLRNSTRIRCALGPVTTIILFAAKGARTLIVLKIKLNPWILANAFDRPIRLDKPAARTTICSLESSLRIIDTVSQMPTQPHPVRLDTSLEVLAERLCALHEPCVIATVISASGSTYRKPGARMLVEGDGRITGLLSGGCFEQDLREHAARVLSSGVARTVTYDMRADNDLIFGIGSGCEGCMGILLEPSHAGAASAKAVLEASATSHNGQSVALVSVFDGPDAELGTLLWHDHLQSPVSEALAKACVRAVDSRRSQSVSWMDSNLPRRAWIQVVLPPPAVLICGGGPDAEPLVAGLRTLRYPVTVFDHRPAYANVEKFPGASVISGPAASLGSRVEFQRFFAAVVMSHHLASDAAYLRALAGTGVEYVGLLGPRPRRDRLLEEIGNAARDIEPRLHAPIGLDIGATTPEGIALAIVAEIHAAAAGRIGGSFGSQRAALPKIQNG
jgi:xanthine dehydrogenase accessory factor